MDSRALAVNGITNEDITDPKKKSLNELTADFAEWLRPVEDRTLGGHNTGFDIRMLRAAFKKAKSETWIPYAMIDIHNVVYAHMKRAKQPIPINRYGFFSIKADHVYKYVGLPDEPTPHHALTGAKMEAEAMSRLIYEKNLLAEFKHYPVPDYLCR